MSDISLLTDQSDRNILSLQDHPVNSTECKLEKENKCAIVTTRKKEKECRKILKKQCEEVTEVVTEIQQVFRTIIIFNIKKININS